MSIIVFLLYLVWGLFSFLTQSNDRLRKKFKTVDPLGLIPNYRFFCPNPIRIDYHLYYRTRQMDTGDSAWTEIVIGKRSRYASFLWNPLKRDRKILYKTVKLLRARGGNKEDNHPYLALLHWVRTQYSPDPLQDLQFRITSRQDLVPESVEREVFRSDFHTVNPTNEPVVFA